jgi:hypothetical protein
MKNRLMALAAMAAALGAMALADPGEVTAEPAKVPQTEFPCAEDEVLGYAPQFGPDHVGCIHTDTLTGKA